MIRARSILVGAAIAAAILAWPLSLGSLGPAVTSAVTSAATCTFGGFGGGPGSGSAPSGPGVLGAITGLNSPGAPGVDAATGRLYIPEQAAKRIAVVNARGASGSLGIAARVTVGAFPPAAVVDPGTGHVFVADSASCEITEIDGRASTPTVIRTVKLPANPYAIAENPATGHVFVAIVAANQVLVYGSDLGLLATLSTGVAPVDIAVDPARGLVFVASTGGQFNSTVLGSIDVISDTASPTIHDAAFVGAWPHAVTFDPVSGYAFAVESRSGIIDTLSVGADGSLSAVASTPAYPPGTANASTLAIAVLGSAREVVVPTAAAGLVNVFAIGSDGSLALVQTISGITSFVPMAVDDTAGTVFVADSGNGRVDVLQPVAAGPLPSPSPSVGPVPSSGPSPSAGASPVASPSAAAAGPSASPLASGAAAASPAQSAGPGGPPATATPGNGTAGLGPTPSPGAGTPAPPPPLEFVLPGPFDISLAPADIARSIGVTAFVMLLIGAPTPIFNSTLSAHRELIGRWLRRKRPRRKAGQKRRATLGSRLAALSKTPRGLVIYLAVTALLYSLLDPKFPFGSPLDVLVATIAGIAIGTALSQIPGELYVRRRYHDRGHVRVALWTLVLAAVCVVLTRITGVQPGYVYGIIGGFAFSVALTPADEGRMAFRGMGILLLVGIAAWFLRIPFQPAPGAVVSASLANTVLSRIFIGAVEGVAIGLIPLRFLEGEALSRWSRWRWLVLWGIGLALFAHVILYPVSSFEPDPSAVGLWTIIATVAVYGLAAVGFWWFFQRRDARKERYRKRAEAAAAKENVSAA